MKKALVLLLVITALTGCSRETVHNRIHKRFYDMPSYTTHCNVTVISNKTENTYPVYALYDSQSDRYRIDSRDFSVIIGRENGLLISDGCKRIIPTVYGNMLMLVNRFFESYYAAEDSQSVEKTANDMLILRCSLINAPEYASHMELWVSEKDILPQRMAVYDNKGKEKILVKFTDFKIVKSIDDSKFAE